MRIWRHAGGFDARRCAVAANPRRSLDMPRSMPPGSAVRRPWTPPRHGGAAGGRQLGDHPRTRPSHRHGDRTCHRRGIGAGAGRAAPLGRARCVLLDEPPRRSPRSSPSWSAPRRRASARACASCATCCWRGGRSMTGRDCEVCRAVGDGSRSASPSATNAPPPSSTCPGAPRSQGPRRAHGDAGRTHVGHPAVDPPAGFDDRVMAAFRDDVDGSHGVGAAGPGAEPASTRTRHWRRLRPSS